MADDRENREQKLQVLAYQLWDAAGRPPGRDDEFWRMAEERLDRGQSAVRNDEVDAAGEHSFPASDPVNHM